ncbi:MAG TPA: hypothetical protein VNT60_02540 [Deinococcales bacterium]|nr:hypothetical protein [Deinococcales bacterium]
MTDDNASEDQTTAPVVTGGMRSGDDKPMDPDRAGVQWGAAEDDDAHAALGDDADLTPDEAAEVLFGDEADEVRSFKGSQQEDEGAEP